MRRRNFLAFLSALPAVSIFGWRPFQRYPEAGVLYERRIAEALNAPTAATASSLKEVVRVMEHHRVEPWEDEYGRKYYILHALPEVLRAMGHKVEMTLHHGKRGVARAYYA